MFYDFTLEIYKEMQEINEIGQNLSSYDFDYSIMCDIQPSTEQLLYKTFGRDIESTYTVYCDENLKVGSIVKYDGNTYMINQKIDWIDYRIYSIIDCEVSTND